jgi:hypothetical protein
MAIILWQESYFFSSLLGHESLSKFPIYAAFGVPEIWRYDADSLTIYHLRDEEYVQSETSQSLPLLTEIRYPYGRLPNANALRNNHRS